MRTNFWFTRSFKKTRRLCKGVVTKLVERCNCEFCQEIKHKDSFYGDDELWDITVLNAIRDIIADWMTVISNKIMDYVVNVEV